MLSNLDPPLTKLSGYGHGPHYIHVYSKNIRDEKSDVNCYFDLQNIFLLINKTNMIKICAPSWTKYVKKIFKSSLNYNNFMDKTTTLSYQANYK